MTPRPTEDLSPAWTFVLMTGRPAPARMVGWVAQALERDIDRRVRALWAVHGARLTREAATAGFAPAGIGPTCPRGPAANTWAQQFLDAHRY